MKIGIITSGNEVLTLFKFLNKFDNQYVVYYDQVNRPYGDNTFEYSLDCVQKWIDFLKKTWVEKIIVPPIYELYFLDKNQNSDIIIPLFQTYVLDYVFQNSLVWKIGIFWDFADVQVAQGLVNNLSKQYSLNDNQSKIKKFHFPFKFWVKETQMWKYFSRKLSFSNILVNKIIKFDLRYFKDSNVDSLIPLNYEYFNYQKTICKFFNYKKQRFHKLEKLEEVFLSLVSNNSDVYSVDLYYNWHADFVKREKKLLWLLQRWKTVEVNFKSV